MPSVPERSTGPAAGKCRSPGARTRRRAFRPVVISVSAPVRRVRPVMADALRCPARRSSADTVPDPPRRLRRRVLRPRPPDPIAVPRRVARRSSAAVPERRSRNVPRHPPLPVVRRVTRADGRNRSTCRRLPPSRRIPLLTIRRGRAFRAPRPAAARPPSPRCRRPAKPRRSRRSRRPSRSKHRSWDVPRPLTTPSRAASFGTTPQGRRRSSRAHRRVCTKLLRVPPLPVRAPHLHPNTAAPRNAVIRLPPSARARRRVRRTAAGATPVVAAALRVLRPAIATPRARTKSRSSASA